MRLALVNIEAGRSAQALRHSVQLPSDRRRKDQIAAAPNQLQRWQRADGLRITVRETAIDKHQSADIHAIDGRSGGDLRTERYAEHADLATMVWPGVEIGNRALNCRGPVRQPFFIVADAGAGACKARNGIQIGCRKHMNEIGVETGCAEGLPNLIVGGLAATLAAPPV